ncbi:discoidin domain-containing protein [Terrimonas sp. NA20]|uniref:Discoidin domain-containing protein n=1 Tax=Terrimonas ginsenosidimutans TaxID=2908004 RepID=A0ABS9KSL4_9BACT|nr:discoidin domain-containing protein [Terrimonas ginsenosidimutans]MCG2615323.1 discoidin domain-containing protein [Terrimonas ginsenosidimutans]
MKKMFSKNIVSGLAGCFLLASLVTSCKKDELSSREMLVFLQPDKAGIPTRTQTVAFVHNPVEVIGSTNAEVFAYTSREVPANVEIQLAADPSKLAEYNTLYAANCIILPDANYRLVNGNKYSIAAGSSQSDPIAIEILNPGQLQNPGGYLLPLTIQSISSSDKGVAVSSTHATVYVRVTYEFNNIARTQAPLTGGTLLSRTGWVLTVSNTTSGALGPAMVDGNNATAWRSSNSATALKWVQVDLGAQRTMKGFQLVPNYAAVAENATRMTVSTSNDNITWTVQGVWNGTGPATTSSATNPDLKGVNFASPVAARYFRLDINAQTSGNRVGIGELNVVQ